MDLKKLSEPLPISSIDFRVQSINKWWYATILAYKDARVDMNRLDEVVWPLNWKREHIRDNKNCIVSIWDEDKKEWVGKEDTGVESNTEQEKWLASDSFKRACFNWWIGRELYDYPVISIKLNKNEYEEVNGKMKQTYELNIKKWEWTSEYKYWTLVSLKCSDWSATRFSYEAQCTYEYFVNELKNAKTYDELSGVYASAITAYPNKKQDLVEVCKSTWLKK